MHDLEPITEEEWRDALDPVLEAEGEKQRRYHYWTRQEIAVLLRYYPTLDPLVLAQRLGRSLCAIRNAWQRFRHLRE